MIHHLGNNAFQVKASKLLVRFGKRSWFVIDVTLVLRFKSLLTFGFIKDTKAVSETSSLHYIT